MDHIATAVDPFVSRGIPVSGLEPSCLLTFRDEIPALLKDERAAAGGRRLTGVAREIHGLRSQGLRGAAPRRAAMPGQRSRSGGSPT